MNTAYVRGLAHYLPEQVVNHDHIESQVAFDDLPKGALKKYLGEHTRRFAEKGVQVSDLAVQAAKNLMKKYQRFEFDLLIFAAASSDLIEPSTASIIQSKLGLKCPVFDLKNACNGFTNALHVATSFIQTGAYKNILIVNGEKLSEVINYEPEDANHLKRLLAAYSLGDAGVAMWLSNDGEHSLGYQTLASHGEYWDLCSVRGGGSMAFRDPKAYYFESDSVALRNAFRVHTFEFFESALKASGFDRLDFNRVICHQITSSTIKEVSSNLDIPLDRFYQAFPLSGNVAAGTVPLSLSMAEEESALNSGDLILLLGFAAGISLSFQVIRW
ncbi:MAG: ketoacyl-ACP synthase III [Flavobacteriia bacterium]|nr:ketoacyl-ACP synthase III [Flavobacteriia bacterium]